MIAFSGVRSSWDMLARNCDLCWLASASWLFASWSASNSRAFSMAMHGLVRERLQQSDLPVRERAARRGSDITSDCLVIAEQRRDSLRPQARTSGRSCAGKRRRLQSATRNMDGASFASGERRHRAAATVRSRRRVTAAAWRERRSPRQPSSLAARIARDRVRRLVVLVDDAAVERRLRSVGDDAMTRSISRWPSS